MENGNRQAGTHMSAPERSDVIFFWVTVVFALGVAVWGAFFSGASV